jgi:hypothetical protein
MASRRWWKMAMPHWLTVSLMVWKQNWGIVFWVQNGEIYTVWVPFYQSTGKFNVFILTFIFTCHIYEGSIGLVMRKMKKKSPIFPFKDFLWINNMIWAINFFPSVTRRCRRCCRCWTKFVSTLQTLPWKLESWNFGYRSLLMHLILRILKFDILRVPPIQIPTEKVQTLRFC